MAKHYPVYGDFMKQLLLLFVSVTAVACYNPFSDANPDLTPVRDLKLIARTLTVPDKYNGAVDIEHPVYLPADFTAKVFYAGRLDKARFMAWGPDSVLYVANKNSGEVLALPDRDKDGVADEAVVAVEGLDKPHDLTFYNGALYVTEERRVIKLTDDNRDGIYEHRSVFIDSLAQGAQQPGGGHDTRTIVFDPKNHRVFISIGSSCNICREQERAIIEVYNEDGTGRQVYANGARNAVGMTLHPVTGELWATNNGSDWQGDNIPPEWIDIVRPGGFYGHPFASYPGPTYYNFDIVVGGYRDIPPITTADSALVKKMVPPAALVQAHTAPMAIEFSNASFPEQFRNGAFIALRGSWNRQKPAGYKVVYMQLSGSRDTTAEYIGDFMTGFLTQEADVWARPVGLATDSRGNLYVSSDDKEEFIAIISRTQK